MLKNQKIIIGISSGIAAYKIIDLILFLKKRLIDVYPVMTKKATEMIDPLKFEKASGHKVYTSLFPQGFDYRDILEKREVEHVKLADSAALFVIAPATANIIGKIASGLADDFLTTTLMATTAPVLICPSMNVHMWRHPSVQNNLRKLMDLGYYILPPDSGRLACGYEGVGRLADTKIIAEEILRLLTKKNELAGKKFLVTAGGTSEPVDAVRVITNRGSGKMGVALAEESFKRGAEVLLLRSHSSVSPQININESLFETVSELEDLIRKNISKFDYIFHTAAVSDFIPEKRTDSKIDSSKPLILRLKPAPKILHMIKKWNPKIKVVGFKAVYKLSEKDLIREGREKLTVSNSDYIIVNDVGREGIGFGTDTNEVYILSGKSQSLKVNKSPKKEIARRILDYIFNSN